MKSGFARKSSSVARNARERAVGKSRALNEGVDASRAARVEPANRATVEPVLIKVMSEIERGLKLKRSE